MCVETYEKGVRVRTTSPQLRMEEDQQSDAPIFDHAASLEPKIVNNQLSPHDCEPRTENPPECSQI